MFSQIVIIASALLPFASLTSASPGYIALDFSVTRGSSRNFTGPIVHAKRSDVVGLDIFDKSYFYSTDLLLGSNKQNISVVIDTGSSDLWVNSASNTQCTSDCAAAGSFNSSQSTSFKGTDNAFSAAYQDGSSTSGKWVSDDASFTSGGPVVKGLTFGLAESSSHEGILGIGLKSLESTQTEYDNLPYLLAAQDLISKPAYSVYLNPTRGEKGTVLFGAIDNAKYDGNLVKLPHAGPVQRLGVQLDSFGVDSTTIQTNIPGILDTGYTYTFLPDAFVSQLAKALGSVSSGTVPGSLNSKQYYIPQDGVSNKTVKFNFNGVSISIPLIELTSPLTYTATGLPAPFYALTIFGTQDKDESWNAIGDNVLRRIYALYDLTDSSISIAQVKETTDTNIQPL
ncbi:candidapepsin-3 [[Candida] anglica]|uniref:candidapepsin n=1 Tax=[Candida] anglica TaxID=148631 RepID=A0ABP0EA32_9ASCO